MAQVQKKFIAPNAVDGTKVRLSNNETLRARNAANSADVDVLKVDSSDKIQFSSIPQIPGTPSADQDVASKKYVDDATSGSTPAASAVTYDHTASGLAATNVQSAIDEVVSNANTTNSNVSAASAKIGHLETLSGRPSGSDNLGTFTGVTIGDNETIKQALQDLETATELRALDSAVIKKDGSVAFTGDQSMGGNKLTNLANPVSSGDAVSLSYMNARLQGVKPKAAVRVGTLVNGTLASAFANGSVVDGVTLATGDRILIKNQTSSADNGIYTVNASGAPTRATDFDSVSPIDEINGAWVAVQEGSQAGEIWVQFGTVSTIGADPINFEYFNALAGLVGGDMISLSSSIISVDLAATSGLESTNPGNAGGQLRVKVEASNPSLQIDGSNQLGAKLDPAGTITSGASGLKVNPDGSTLETNSNQLRIKDAGVNENKIASSAISTTGALNGGSGTKLSTRVDSSTVKINGSNNLEGLKELEQKITLVSGDITNQYVDLAHAVYGADAANNSISLWVIGGPVQEKAVDYTVSLTGGSGGVTRVTFAGDLATGGSAALVAADKLVVRYQYLT